VVPYEQGNAAGVGEGVTVGVGVTGNCPEQTCNVLTVKLVFGSPPAKQLAHIHKFIVSPAEV